MEYHFRSLNETAIVERLDGVDRLVRLHYQNPFYGSCRLRLRFLRLPDGRPWIDPDSLQVESCETRKGDPRSLLSVAQGYLIHLASQHPEIMDHGARGRVSGGGMADRLLRWFSPWGSFRSPGSKDAENSAQKAHLT